MTNKTREKLVDKLREEFYERWGAFYGVDRLLMKSYSGDEIWDFIEKSITQSNNRILRKWKKAIDKILYSYPLLDEFYRRMNEEYLKAKKEINK